MLAKGPAKKVTIYLNEDTRHGMGPLYQAVLDYLRHKGVAGATATRGVAGFGSHHTLHTPKIEALAEHLPLHIEFVDTPEKTAEVLPTLSEMVTDGLIEVQDTTILKSAIHDPKARVVERRPHERRQGPAKMIRIFLGEADHWQGEPLHEAIVERLRAIGVGGATVFRGVLGYGAKGATHKESFFHRSRDLPVMITAVDTPEKIAEAAAAVEEMMDDGMIVLSEVDMIRLIRGGGAAS